MHQRGGCEQGVYGGQGAPGSANESAPSIRDRRVHGQYPPREEKRQIRFEPAGQYLASRHVQRTLYPFGNFAQGQLRSSESILVSIR